MTVCRRVVLVFAVAAVLCPGFAIGQKVKVEYDKSIDFAKFKTYSWGQLDSARMPLLRTSLIAAIDRELQAKGLTRVEKDADLMVASVGGMTAESNQGVNPPTYPGYAGPPPTVNSTMWTGSSATGAGGSFIYPKGTLVVELMDPRAARVAWRAVGSVKLDMEKKKEALETIHKLIAKMFASYPPEKT